MMPMPAKPWSYFERLLRNARIHLPRDERPGWIELSWETIRRMEQEDADAEAANR